METCYMLVTHFKLYDTPFFSGYCLRLRVLSVLVGPNTGANFSKGKSSMYAPRNLFYDSHTTFKHFFIFILQRRSIGAQNSHLYSGAKSLF